MCDLSNLHGWYALFAYQLCTSHNQKIPSILNVRFANTHQRGYLTLELTPMSCSVTLRALTSEKQPDSAIATAAKFVVEAGTPGVQLR